MMKLETHFTRQLPGRQIIYLSSEFSLITTGMPYSLVAASILINDLGIDFSEDGVAIGVKGLLPHTIWRRTVVKKPMAQSGILKLTEQLTPGVSIRVNREGERWPIFFDEDSKWIFLGEAPDSSGWCVEFLPDCVMRLKEGWVTGLWLRPLWQ